MSRRLLKILPITRPNTPGRWGIDYRSPWEVDAAGKRKRIKQFFRKKQDRDDAIETLLRRYAKSGESSGGDLSASELEDYRAARAMLPPDVLLREAARSYVNQVKPVTPLFSKVANAYLASMRARGLSDGWILSVKSTLENMFGAFIGERTRIGDVTTDRGRAWMKSLEPKMKHGKLVGGYADESRNNYRRRVHALFEFAIKEKQWTRVTENPFARVEIPKINRGAPVFYTVEEARAILGATLLHCPDFIAFVVLRMFAGVRRAEVMRMIPDDLHSKERMIELPGFRRTESKNVRVTKSGKGRIIEDLPPVIWEWLDRYPEINTASSHENFRLIFGAAGLKAKRNGFRHSFPTYHVALKQNAGHTILILGQEEDSKVFYTHYRNPRITKEKAEAYFDLGPDAVLPLVREMESTSSLRSA